MEQEIEREQERGKQSGWRYIRELWNMHKLQQDGAACCHISCWPMLHALHFCAAAMKIVIVAICCTVLSVK